MTKIVKKASVLLSNNTTTTTTATTTAKAKAKRKAQAKKVVAKKVVAKKKVSRRKTAEQKLSSAVAKMAPDALTPVKMTTSDFLSFLATSIESGTGVNYGSPKGAVGVLPRKPQELAGTIKYLKRQATMLNK
jgi:hypothetical protein